MSSALAPSVRLDRQELALIVPFIEGAVLVEALVTLQADQLDLVKRRQRLSDLGLTDSSFAFQKQRTLEEIHQPQRRRQVVVGDIVHRGEALAD